MNHSLKTLFTGRHVTLLETVNSTNSFMNDLLSQQKIPEGAVVMAKQQTEGRGQAGERWLSEPGKNLLLSFVFYPVFLSPQNLFSLSKAFSLGVCDGIKQITELKPKIKWPNDIYIGDKKAGGLLIENSIRNPQVNHTILGVGINVNQLNFSAELPNPVSLKMISGTDYSIETCFSVICNSIERRYLQLKTGHEDQIHEDYLSVIYRLGEFHEFENDHERFKAKITAIAEDGRILMKRDTGVIERYDFKKVRFVV